MDDEPEPRWEWRLEQSLMHQPTRRELSVTITKTDAFGEAREVVLQCICDPDVFATAVLAAFKTLVSESKLGAGQERWGPMPLRAIAALDGALNAVGVPEV